MREYLAGLHDMIEDWLLDYLPTAWSAENMQPLRLPFSKRVQRKFVLKLLDVLRTCRAALCWFGNHNIVPDHCGFPWHNYCETCGKPTPNLSTDVARFAYALELDAKHRHER